MDEKTPHHDDTEAELAAFFDAARAETPAPTLPLMSAILADAAGVSAQRASTPALAVAPEPRRRPWREAVALVAAAVTGLWVGLASDLQLASPISWTTASADATDGTDPVVDFFDLASTEN